VLGLICHRSNGALVVAVQNWFAALRDRKLEIAVPEISDYELRRSLLKLESGTSIMTLDNLATEAVYLPLNTTIMRRAALLWAESRRLGRVTARDAALDGDIILASQAIEVEATGVPVLVVSTNVRHLEWFVPTQEWSDIDPSDPALDVHIRQGRRQ
jgi:predicted nucleic acid-binding protein